MNDKEPFVIWMLRQLLNAKFFCMSDEDRRLAQVALEAVIKQPIMTQQEFLKTLEDSLIYFDAQDLEKHREMLWTLFLTGKIESRMIIRHGKPVAEIIKPWPKRMKP